MTAAKKTKWSRAEDRVLAERYPEVGSAWDGWRDVLPGRSEASIRGRAKRLGLTAPQGSAGFCEGHGSWSESELAALRANYVERGPGWCGWADLLPGRSYAAIVTRAKKLGLVTRRTARSRAGKARCRKGPEGRRCGDCMQFLPSPNPLVDAGTCASVRVRTTLGLTRRPSVLVTSDATECDAFEPMAPLFAGGLSGDGWIYTTAGDNRADDAGKRGER